MSNIFDALSKQKGATGHASPESLVPLSPELAGATPLPSVGDPDRDLELELLRQRILLEVGPVGSATLVFSGAVEGEGSTTMALLFARELARAEGRPVLLVDADIAGYPSTLSGALGEESPTPGFTDLLEGKAELSATLLATDQPNLHFLPRGSDFGQPLDVIKADRIQRFYKELEQHYAFIVVDSAPLLHSPETSLLSAGSDGVVVVVRANRTRREIVQKALRMLQNANCKVLGAVLNERKYPIPSFIYRRL